MTIHAQERQIQTAEAFENDGERYSFIIDCACDTLDELFSRNNYCDFINGACAYARTANPATKSVKGCCTSYKLRRVLTVDFMYDHKTCAYLGESGCVKKCISCKLFCCSYLRKKGVNFRAEDLEILTRFLNQIQLKAVNVNFFRPKDQVIEKLLRLKNNKLPYVWFLLTGGHFVRGKFPE